MFYAHFVLAKKGPLARIWLAAHWDKKLTKAHVFETNIEKSVDGILQPKVKMALRTSGHLLLGVVRIYSRKAKYLLADCNEAFVKIKMAFRPGMVDLPEDIREAAVSAITLPEVFHDFDTAMPELNDVDIQAQFTLNQSRAEEITMREDYGNISLVTGDDGFGDMGFEEPPDIMRDASPMDQTLDHPNLIFGEGTPLDKEKEANISKEQDSRLAPGRADTTALDLEAPIRDDGFGGNLGQDIIAGGLFEGGLFDDTPIGDGPSLDEPKEERHDDSDDDAGDLDRFGGPPSVGPPTSDDGSRPSSPKPEVQDPAEAVEAPPAENAETPAQDANDETAGHEQTTLLQNEEESFALAPVDASAIKSGWPRAKRKRKLIVDEVKNISGEEMKAQLSDTTDIVTTLDLAPPTKRLMHWKETGGVEKLFALPGRPIHARPLARIYQRHLTSEPSQNEDFGMAGDREVENLSLEVVRDSDEIEIIPVKPTRGRPQKRKQAEMDLDDEEELQVLNVTTRSRSGAGAAAAAAAAATAAEASERSDLNNQIMSPQAPETPAAPAPAEDAPLTPAAAPPELITIDEPVEVAAPHTPAPATPAPPPADIADIPSVAPQTPAPATPAPPLQSPTSVHAETHEANQTPAHTTPFQSPVHMDTENHGYIENQPSVDNREYDNAHPPANTPGAHSDGGPRSVYSEHPNTPGPQTRIEEEEEEEEQADDETYEQFEERVVNKRAAHMFHTIRRKIGPGKNVKGKSINFTEFVQKNNRKQVAQKFYTMLVLKKLQAVELHQDSAFSEILISPGPMYDNPSL